MWLQKLLRQHHDFLQALIQQSDAWRLFQKADETLPKDSDSEEDSRRLSTCFTGDAARRRDVGPLACVRLRAGAVFFCFFSFTVFQTAELHLLAVQQKPHYETERERNSCSDFPAVRCSPFQNAAQKEKYG